MIMKVKHKQDIELEAVKTVCKDTGKEKWMVSDRYGNNEFYTEDEFWDKFDITDLPFDNKEVLTFGEDKDE